MDCFLSILVTFILTVLNGKTAERLWHCYNMCWQCYYYNTSYKRWCKSQKREIYAKQPANVKNYVAALRGIGLWGRLIAYYRVLCAHENELCEPSITFWIRVLWSRSRRFNSFPSQLHLRVNYPCVLTILWFRLTWR